MRGFLKAALATVAFGALHSLLAARGTKRAAARHLGDRHRDGLYRPFYIAQSFATLGALMWYIRSLRRHELYRVSGWPALVMRTGQLSALGWAAMAAGHVGIFDISGARQLAVWAAGGDAGPEPEAQGPAPGEDAMHVAGPFRFSRHPLNLAPLPIFWLQPAMTTRLLGFIGVSTLYLVLGSIHEERRLEAAYGERYRDYLRSDVPFYLPIP